MKEKLIALVVAVVASVPPARGCPPMDPGEADRLQQACTTVVTKEVEAQFHALTERASVETREMGALDPSALKAALESAAAEAHASPVLLLVNVRYCRVNADPDAEDDCGPALNLLNTGLQGYDPNHETPAMLAGRRAVGRSLAYRHPRAQPPAYGELQCLAVGTAGEGSATPPQQTPPKVKPVPADTLPSFQSPDDRGTFRGERGSFLDDRGSFHNRPER